MRRAFTFTLGIARAEPFFPGAWFSTRQLPAKQAGAIEVNFFEDNTLRFDIYLGPDFLESVDGTFDEFAKFYTFTIVDSEGWTWRGKLLKKTGQLTGTFRSATGATRGKFQATQEDDGL